jgi:hypothetical protein
MTDDEQNIQKLIDYCDAKWIEAAEEPPSAFPTKDMLTGKKMAYNEVLQFARRLLADVAEEVKHGG